MNTIKIGEVSTLYNTLRNIYLHILGGFIKNKLLTNTPSNDGHVKPKEYSSNKLLANTSSNDEHVKPEEFRAIVASFINPSNDEHVKPEECSSNKLLANISSDDKNKPLMNTSFYNILLKKGIKDTEARKVAIESAKKDPNFLAIDGSLQELISCVDGFSQEFHSHTNSSNKKIRGYVDNSFGNLQKSIAISYSASLKSIKQNKLSMLIIILGGLLIFATFISVLSILI